MRSRRAGAPPRGGNAPATFGLCGIGLATLAALAMFTLGGIAALGQSASTRSAAELMDVVMWNREPIGGPFRLVDQNGVPRTEADFRGKLMLVYFGFTYCPDICPTDLQDITLALDALGSAADAVQPLFVTLDPERDTAEHLKEYLALFHPRMVGLTGTPAAIHQAAEAYRVFYAKVPITGAQDYTVDHSAFIYLMAADGTYLGFFPPGTPPAAIAEALRPRLAQRQ